MSQSKNNLKICIIRQAGEAEKFAAEQLRTYIDKSLNTGSIRIVMIGEDERLEKNAFEQNIILLKGETAKKKFSLFDFSLLNYDGYFIKSSDSDIYICSANDRGIIFGVYGFLEKFFKIKFLTPDCTIIPNVDYVSLNNVDIVESPDFPMRLYLGGYSYGENHFKDKVDYDFCSKMRFNGTFIQPSEKYGGKCNMYGRNQDHNFHCYVPREKYYESHPEFYYHSKKYDIGGDNGWTIDLQNGITEDGKLDESMDISVAKIVIEEMKKDIVAMPHIDFFVFEQEDGPFFYKYKKNSLKQRIAKKYGRSGLLIRFCNVVAEELQKWADKTQGGRKINIVTFAYDYSAAAPVKAVKGKLVPIDDTVVAKNNLVIRIAIGGNRYYSYFDNKQYDWVKNAINTWTVIAKNFMFWSYDADFIDYPWYIPFLNRVDSDMENFKKMGIKYLLVQGIYNTTGYWLDLIKNYIYSKMMWDTELNARALLDEYLQGYYDISASYVRELIYLFEDHFKKTEEKEGYLKIRICEDVGYKLPKYYSANLLENALDIIEKAILKVRESRYSNSKKEILTRRLLSVKITPMYIKLKLFEYLYPNFSPLDKQILADEFYGICVECGITMFNEGETLKMNKERLKQKAEFEE